MPELPEVETLRQALGSSELVGARISQVKRSPLKLRFNDPKGLARTLKGAVVSSVLRRAKYLIFETDQGALINHLGMTGSWRFGSWQHPQKHDHFCLKLESGSDLIFNDPRRFGYVDLSKGPWIEASWFQHLGPEPLSPDFNEHYLLAQLKALRSPIKVAIMNQKLVVGVGNIYASEALFVSQIHPLTRANDLSLEQCRELVASIKQVLTSAIVSGGTSFRDFKSLYGEKGRNISNLCVYGLKDEHCRYCGSLIEGFTLAQRSTFFCPSCQPLG